MLFLVPIVCCQWASDFFFTTVPSYLKPQPLIIINLACYLLVLEEVSIISSKITVHTLKLPVTYKIDLKNETDPPHEVSNLVIQLHFLNASAPVHSIIIISHIDIQ